VGPDQCVQERVVERVGEIGGPRSGVTVPLEERLVRVSRVNEDSYAERGSRSEIGSRRGGDQDHPKAVEWRVRHELRKLPRPVRAIVEQHNLGSLLHALQHRLLLDEKA
jgi:hypothetical protein